MGRGRQMVRAIVHENAQAHTHGSETPRRIVVLSQVPRPSLVPPIVFTYLVRWHYDVPQQGASGNSAAATRHHRLTLAQFPRNRVGSFHSERDQAGCPCLRIRMSIRTSTRVHRRFAVRNPASWAHGPSRPGRAVKHPCAI